MPRLHGCGQFKTPGRLFRTMREARDIPISEASILKMIRRGAKRWKPASVAIDEWVPWVEFVENVDERGLRIECTPQYQRVKYAEALTALRISVSRKHLLPA